MATGTGRPGVAPADHDGVEGQSARPTAARLVASLVGPAVALHAFGSGKPSPRFHIDPSRTAVLGLAHANSAAFGKEVLFTYCPLGFLNSRAAYTPEAYFIFLAGQLMLAALAGLATALSMSPPHAHRQGPSVRIGVAPTKRLPDRFRR